MPVVIEEKPLSVDVKTLLEHTRSQFQYHAKQRLDSIRYFFAGLGLVGALVVKMHTDSDPNLVAVILVTFTALLYTACFWALDFRNAQMVETDEEALKEIEKIVGEKFGLDDFEATRLNEKDEQWRRYKVVMRVMFGYLFLVLCLSLFLDAARLLCHR